MSSRVLVDCPLGNRCNGGGRHYQDSDVYRIHQEMANRSGNSSGGKSQKEKYNKAANPMGDVNSGDYTDHSAIDYDESIFDNPALIAMGAVAWTSYLKKRHSEKKFKLSVVEEINADEENEEFSVEFKTGDSILFQKSENEEGHFTAIRFDGEMNEVSREEVPIEEVESYIKENDDTNKKKYAAGVVTTGAMSYAAASYARGRRRRQAEKTAERSAAARSDASWARHPALKWLANLFDNVTPFGGSS